ncbi:hypothetical protein QYE77_11295 [Thermanaerothrix sp. 4228-RoL]|uniref:Glycerophosphoryl diester phosphodiesterase membrane domain-containing protein n=1 Tax=Thermanaerothrix solaris TaxID=3058434 RepID=A0ABU3NRY8_9CHLR|nr:hypothetical protein [Thermanaerothrix sp. 4228-RoL]MDT8898847.1 hypothetical protein [Thermanaerothrix sp. 4228-RoL]
MMIDPLKILKRSWHILWHYRTLWLFGLILALTASGGGGMGNVNNLFSYRMEGNGGAPSGVFERWLEEFFRPLAQVPEHQLLPTLVGLVIVLICIFGIVGITLAIAHYVSQVALIRLVDDYEAQGVRASFRQGWRLGWSRKAWQLFLIDLLLGLPIVILVLLIIPLIGLFIVGASAQTPAITAPAVIIGIGLALLWFVVLILVSILIGIVGEIARRACVLQEMGVIEALRHALGLLRRQWKNAGLMWLVVLGIGIGWGIATLILFFLLIPLYLFMIIPALVIVGLPGLVIFGLASLFLAQPLAVLTALILVLPPFFLIVFSPLVLLGAWEQVFLSSLWTLTYREIMALESVNLTNDLTLAG